MYRWRWSISVIADYCFSSKRIAAGHLNTLLLLIETGYWWSLKQVTASHWNRLLMVNENGYCCSLKQVTNGHWNRLLMVTDAGYCYSLKQVTGGHWNMLLLLIETCYCCHWNRLLLLIETGTVFTESDYCCSLKQVTAVTETGSWRSWKHGTWRNNSRFYFILGDFLILMYISICLHVSVLYYYQFVLSQYYFISFLSTNLLSVNSYTHLFFPFGMVIYYMNTIQYTLESILIIFASILTFNMCLKPCITLKI